MAENMQRDGNLSSSSCPSFLSSLSTDPSSSPSASISSFSSSTASSSSFSSSSLLSPAIVAPMPSSSSPPLDPKSLLELLKDPQSSPSPIHQPNDDKSNKLRRHEADRQFALFKSVKQQVKANTRLRPGSRGREVVGISQGMLEKRRNATATPTNTQEVATPSTPLLLLPSTTHDQSVDSITDSNSNSNNNSNSNANTVVVSVSPDTTELDSLLSDLSSRFVSASPSSSVTDSSARSDSVSETDNLSVKSKDVEEVAHQIVSRLKLIYNKLISLESVPCSYLITTAFPRIQYLLQQHFLHHFQSLNNLNNLLILSSYDSDHSLNQESELAADRGRHLLKSFIEFHLLRSPKQLFAKYESLYKQAQTQVRERLQPEQKEKKEKEKEKKKKDRFRQMLPKRQYSNVHFEPFITSASITNARATSSLSLSSSASSELKNDNDNSNDSLEFRASLPPPSPSVPTAFEIAEAAAAQQREKEAQEQMNVQRAKIDRLKIREIDLQIHLRMDGGKPTLNWYTQRKEKKAKRTEEAGGVKEKEDENVHQKRGEVVKTVTGYEVVRYSDPLEGEEYKEIQTLLNSLQLLLPPLPSDTTPTPASSSSSNPATAPAPAVSSSSSPSSSTSPFPIIDSPLQSYLHSLLSPSLPYSILYPHTLYNLFEEYDFPCPSLLYEHLPPLLKKELERRRRKEREKEVKELKEQAKKRAREEKQEAERLLRDEIQRQALTMEDKASNSSSRGISPAPAGSLVLARRGSSGRVTTPSSSSSSSTSKWGAVAPPTSAAGKGASTPTDAVVLKEVGRSTSLVSTTSTTSSSSSVSSFPLPPLPPPLSMAERIAKKTALRFGAFYGPMPRAGCARVQEEKGKKERERAKEREKDTQREREKIKGSRRSARKLFEAPMKNEEGSGAAVEALHIEIEPIKAVPSTDTVEEKNTSESVDAAPLQRSVSINLPVALTGVTEMSSSTGPTRKPLLRRNQSLGLRNKLKNNHTNNDRSPSISMQPPASNIAPSTVSQSPDIPKRSSTPTPPSSLLSPSSLSLGLTPLQSAVVSDSGGSRGSGMNSGSGRRRRGNGRSKARAEVEFVPDSDVKRRRPSIRSSVLSTPTSSATSQQVVAATPSSSFHAVMNSGVTSRSGSRKRKSPDDPTSISTTEGLNSRSSSLSSLSSVSRSSSNSSTSDSRSSSGASLSINRRLVDTFSKVARTGLDNRIQPNTADSESELVIPSPFDQFTRSLISPCK